MKSRYLLILAVAVAALSAGVLVRLNLSTPAAPAPEPAQVLPKIEAPALTAPLPDLPDTQGVVHSFSEWQGKVVVVNFWATWCEPCREEMPEFQQLQSEFGSKGLQFIGIALDEPEDVEEFLKSTPVNYPILIGGDRGIPLAESLGNHYGVLPFSVVFDRNGRIVGAKQGLFKREEVVKMVQPLLSAQAVR